MENHDDLATEHHEDLPIDLEIKVFYMLREISHLRHAIEALELGRRKEAKNFVECADKMKAYSGRE